MGLAKRLFGILGAMHGKRASEEILGIRQVATSPMSSVFSLAGAFGVMLYYASRFQINVAYALGFFGVTTLVITAWMSYRVLSGLKLSTSKDSSSCTAGEMMKFSFCIEELQGRARKNIIVHAAGQQYEITIKPLSKIVINFEARSLTRGTLLAPMTKISTPYPMGLWNTHHLWYPDQKGFVYPKQETNAPLISGPMDNGNNAGGASELGDHGDSLISLRAYQSGDSLRRVSWRVYARSGGSILATKQSESPVSSIKELAIDESLVEHIANPEKRIERLAAWISQAHIFGAPYSFKAFGVNFAPASGDSHWRECMEVLATAKGAQNLVCDELKI